MNVVQDFEVKLLALDPDLDEFPSDVDDLIVSIDEEYYEKLLPSIFKFFKKYPYCDRHAPSTLVHFVEHFDSCYKPLLVASITNSPNFNSILMVNRILNSKLSDHERGEYLNLLRSVVANNQISESLKERANDFITYQTTKTS